MKKLYLFWLIIDCFTLNSCNAQKSDANKYLIFKVEYMDKQFFGYYSSVYSLISLDKLKSFKTIVDSAKSLPNITYNITANGGLYISESFTDLYTFGCCEYGNIEKAIEQNATGELSNEQIEKYESSNRISLLKFESQAYKRFSLRKGTSKYKITLWMVDLDYCICPLYLETPQQTIYENQAAYLKNVRSVNKPTSKIVKQIKVIMQSIVDVDIPPPLSEE